MPEALLTGVLGFLAVYTAVVTFSLQQVSDRYSPRLLPALLRDRLRWPLLGVLLFAVLISTLVVWRELPGRDGWSVLLLLLGGALGVKLIFDGWALANLDARTGWLTGQQLSPELVEDVLTRLALRRDGVALRELLGAVAGQPEAEVALSQWLLERPDVLVERWCAPVLAVELTRALAWRGTLLIGAARCWWPPCASRFEWGGWSRRSR